MDGMYRALRGVCIGSERHLMPGDPPVRLDRGTAQFLTSIGAIELVPEPAEPAEEAPAEAAPPPAPETTAPAKAGKKEK